MSNTAVEEFPEPIVIDPDYFRDKRTQQLNERGWAIIPGLLTQGECAIAKQAYDFPGRADMFRSRVVMENHGFGRGAYQYYGYPLPNTIQRLREDLYADLVPIANQWHENLRKPDRFPPTHAEFLERCKVAGQTKPTPLLLKYEPGDFNCLHQDLYGENVFPLQVAILLSEPGVDFTGGEFVLTTTIPRQQSKVEVIPLTQGDAVIFAVNSRPAVSTKGQFYTVNMRHGVSPLQSGSRFTLGIIFHDAK